MSDIDKEKEHIIPYSSKVHLPMVLSNGSVLPSSKTLNPFHHSSIQIELVMFNNVDSINVNININGKEIMIPPDYWYILSASIAILSTEPNTYSQFLQCLQVRGAFGSSPHTPFISPMLRMYKRYLGWVIIPFYLLRSMDGMWLISLAISKWSKCIHPSCVPPIWSLPTRTTICSPQWSLMIPD